MVSLADRDSTEAAMSPPTKRKQARIRIAKDTPPAKRFDNVKHWPRDAADSRGDTGRACVLCWARGHRATKSTLECEHCGVVLHAACFYDYHHCTDAQFADCSRIPASVANRRRNA